VLREEEGYPLEAKPPFIEAMRGTAEALAGQRRSADAVKRNLDYLRVHPSVAPQVAQSCVALGARQTAYAILNGYYFNEGEWRSVAPIGGDEDRITNPLFHPVMRSLWREPAFDRLLQRIGLNAYWRRSGSMPDYRRIS
jgi:hypothetical protein